MNEASDVKRLARPGEKPMASGLYALSAFLVIAKACAAAASRELPIKPF